jgi:hypothetical protein
MHPDPPPDFEPTADSALSASRLRIYRGLATLGLGLLLGMLGEVGYRVWVWQGEVRAEASERKREHDRQERMVRQLQRHPHSDARVDWHRPRYPGARLSGVWLDWANLQHADLRDADLSAAELEGTFFWFARLERIDLRHSNLSHASFHAANLQWAKLQHADLREADFSAGLTGTPVDLRNADLREADLRHATLRGARLTSADLRGANLSEADLRGAELTGAKLQGASLESTRAIRHELIATSGLSEEMLTRVHFEPSVYGRVVDIAGRPSVGAEVAIGDPPDWSARATTDAAGQFTLMHWPQGPADSTWLYVRHGDAGVRKFKVPIPRNAAFAVGTLRLPDPRSSRLQVGLPWELRDTDSGTLSQGSQNAVFVERTLPTSAPGWQLMAGQLICAIDGVAVTSVEQAYRLVEGEIGSPVSVTLCRELRYPYLFRRIQYRFTE